MILSADLFLEVFAVEDFLHHKEYFSWINIQGVNWVHCLSFCSFNVWDDYINYRKICCRPRGIKKESFHVLEDRRQEMGAHAAWLTLSSLLAFELVNL